MSDKTRAVVLLSVDPTSPIQRALSYASSYDFAANPTGFSGADILKIFLDGDFRMTRILAVADLVHYTLTNEKLDRKEINLINQELLALVSEPVT
jgi:hypothetical protein